MGAGAARRPAYLHFKIRQPPKSVSEVSNTVENSVNNIGYKHAE